MGLGESTIRRIAPLLACPLVAALALAGCGGGGGGGPSGSEIANVTSFQRRAQSQGLGCRDFTRTVSLPVLQSGTCTLSVEIKKARCRTGKDGEVSVRQQAEGTGAGCGPVGEASTVSVAPKNPQALAFFGYTYCKQLKDSRFINPNPAPVYLVQGRNWVVATSNQGLGIVIANRMGGKVALPKC